MKVDGPAIKNTKTAYKIEIKLSLRIEVDGPQISVSDKIALTVRV